MPSLDTWFVDARGKEMSTAGEGRTQVLQAQRWFCIPITCLEILLGNNIFLVVLLDWSPTHENQKKKNQVVME